MSFKDWEDKVAELAAEEMRAAEKKQLEALVGGNPKGFEAWRLGGGADYVPRENEGMLSGVHRSAAANTAGCNTLSPHRPLGKESWTRPMPLVEGYEERDDEGFILTCSTDPDCGRTHRVVMPGEMVRLIQAPEKARADRAEAYESSELRDKCGALARENRDLLVENARLRRRIEDLERKGKKR